MGRKKKANSIFKITQFQPNDCVTSSAVMVEVGDVCLLFDLGMEQDSTKSFPQIYHNAIQKIQSIPFEKITHVITSHFHYDHVGLLPILMREDINFKGEVIATELTMKIAELIMRDAERINKSDVAKHGGSSKGYFPYYNELHIDELLNITKCYSYGQKIKLSDKVDLELVSACHVSGASMALVTYHTEYKDYRLLYSGDITYGQKIDRPFTMKIDDKKLKVDVLICESTYGLREEHKNSNSNKNPIDFLEEVILNEVVGNNQTLWIPSFACGRATTIYYYLNEIFKRNEEIRKANIPVYFCGSMMNDAHSIIGKDYYDDYYDEQWRNEKEIWRKEPFNFLTTKKDVEHFCYNNGRKIVISSSGMYDKGYSSLLADSYVANKKVSTCACGFQGEGTLGYAISTGESYAVVNGIRKKVRLKFCGSIPELSGHANHEGLLRFVSEHFNQTVLKHIVLVHGDDDAKEQFKEDLENILSKDKKIHIIKQFSTLKL